MKKLIALIAVLSYVPFAHADGEWSNSGDFRLQYFNDTDFDMDSDADDNDQEFQQRFRWNTTVRAGEKMTANLGLVHGSTWGTNSDQYPGAGGTAATTDNNALIVNEAYANWQASDELMIRFGRGSFTMADGSVVSSNDWEQVKKAFDGAMVSLDKEMARVSFFGVQGAKDQTNNLENRIGRFWGLTADFKTLPEFLKMANVHYMAIKRDAGTYGGIGVDKEDTARYGVTLAGDTAGVDYRVTYAMNSGEMQDGGATTNWDVEGSMIDAEVGYSMPEMMNFRASFAYHTDSGDKDGTTDNKSETYAPFHYNSYENAGMMDILGWGNLTYMKVGLSLSPVEDLTVAAHYYMFTKTEKAGASFNSAGFANVTKANSYGLNNAVAGGGTEDELGSELDVVVTKKYTNNFAIGARYSMFQAGDAFGTSPDDPSQAYLEGTLTF